MMARDARITLGPRHGKRFIDRLRRWKPGVWTYDHTAFYPWKHESGLGVRRCCAFAPKFDGDDDSFESRTYTSEGEQIFV